MGTANPNFNLVSSETVEGTTVYDAAGIKVARSII